MNRQPENRNSHPRTPQYGNTVTDYPTRRTIPLRGQRNVSANGENIPQNGNGIPQSRQSAPTSRENIPQKRENIPQMRKNAPSRTPLSPQELQKRQRLNLEREAAKRRKKARLKKYLACAAAVLCILLIVFLIAKLVRETRAEDKTAPVQTEALQTEAQSLPEPEQETVLPAVAYPTVPETVTPLEIDSEYGVLVSLDGNTVIADKRGTERVYPASLAKIMTLIVAVENTPDINTTTFTYTAEMLSPFYQENATLAGFKAGETVSVKDMLFGLILPSGADGAAGLALCIAGSEESFVSMMNETAERIGLANTHFTNPTGLHDENQYSTCMDLAVLLEYAIKNPVCYEVLSTYQYTTAPTEQNPEGIALTSTLFSRMEGGEPETSRVYAGKTGYTTEASNTLATYAKSNSDGSEYIMVTCMGHSIWQPIFDAINTYKLYIK